MVVFIVCFEVPCHMFLMVVFLTNLRTIHMSYCRSFSSILRNIEMKKLLKVFLILFALFVVGLAAAVIIIKVKFPPETVRKLVEKEASKYAKRDIQIKGASLSLFPTLGIEIKGVRISNTGRSNTIKKSTTLWSFLKKQNLDKRFVHVSINGKAHPSVFRDDRPLKVGDVLRIHRKDFRQGKALFALGRLFVAVKVMPLMSRKVVIEKISLEKLKVLVEVDPRGSFNFDDLLGPKSTKKKEKKEKKEKPDTSDEKGESKPLNLRLESFEIKDSSIVYRNQKTQQEITLDDINQTLSVRFDSSMKDVVTKGLFEIKKISVQGKGIPVRKSGVYFMVKHDIHLDMKAGNIQMKQLTLGFQKTFITTTGTVKGYNRKVRDLNIDIRTNTLRLQDLFKEVPPAMFPQARKMSVQGNAKLAVSVKGTLDARKPGVLPAISGLFKISKGRFKYADLPKAINRLNTDIRFTQDSLNIKQFAFQLGTNPISLVAKVNHFKKPVVDLALKANVDLGTLKDAIKLPKGVSVAGVIDANITAKGKVEPKNPEAMNVKGALKLQKIVAVTPSVKKPVHLDGTFNFSNQEVSLGQLVGKIGRSSFQVDMKIRDYLGMALPKKVREKTTVVSFNMKSPLLDLNEMLGVSSKGGSSKSGTSTSSSSGSSSSSSGDEPISIPKLPNVVFTGNIRVKKLLYKNLPISNGAIDLTFKNKQVHFLLNAGLFEGRIKEDIVVNLSNPNRLRIKNSFSCLKVEANDFISNFNDLPQSGDGLFKRLKSMDNTIYGKMDLTSNVTTSGITSKELKNNLSGTIQAKLYKGRIKNATILTQMVATLPKLLKKYMPKLNDISTRKTMNVKMVVKNGKIEISKLSIPARTFALAGYGSISFGSDLNFKLDVALSRRLSRRILRQQKRLQRAAGGLLGKVGGKFGKALSGKLGKMAGRYLIPKDKKGRVVPILGAVGLASKLKYSFLGFRGANSDSSSMQGGKGSLVGSAKKAIKDQINKAKKRALKAAREAKRRALAAANAAKRKALKAARDAKRRAEKQARDAARKAERKARKAAADAARKAREAAARKKKELEDKAKKALKRW